MAIDTVEIQLGKAYRDVDRLRKALANSQQTFSDTIAELDNLPTLYGESIAEINGYATPDTYQEVLQQKLAALTSAFQALRADANDALLELAAHTEW